LDDRFHRLHQHTFGYCQPQRGVQLVVVRCEAKLVAIEATSPIDAVDERVAAERQDAMLAKAETTSIWHDSKWIEAAMIDRPSLRRGQQIEAPAMIVGEHSTLVIEPGWRATVVEEGIISMLPCPLEEDRHRQSLIDVTEEVDAEHDPVLLEVIARRLQGIADAMGEVLRRTSISVNVKERRDYSCAVFRADGSLIANAPHVPVHLGAMGHTVRRIIRVFPEMSPGDCYLSNDPFSGGSHLPDVTSVTPVFCGDERGRRPDFFVASRAHHAEIGGITPGSMPPQARSLAEEGVLIRDFALQRAGVSYQDELQQLLAGAEYPSRLVEENLADIAAQQASGAHGARALRELAKAYSTTLIDTMMQRLLEVSGDAMQRWIETLGTEPMRFTDCLDDGTKIAVEIKRDADQLRVAFDTGPVHPHGFNATPAIVTAAVLYVLRCVCGSNLPLCDGVLRNVTIVIPPGLLDPPANDDPRQCAAVVAGNVETSQRIVDVLLGALNVAAASQGTMNNVLIGDNTFGYYETIGGGSGATAGQAGADAVHTHMTNTRITDPEILETRLPLRLHRFEIRRGSGGEGQHCGGNGIEREFEFLKPLVVSLITSRRTRPPYGAAGGNPGCCGENLLVHQGVRRELPPTGTIEVETGDRLIIRTPGGGGWGIETT
jgi:5-oxoprolinase (ATP-hydrolysing)